MPLEADIPELITVQARNGEEINKTNKKCNMDTENQPPQHTNFKDEETEDDKERKHSVEVRRGNNEQTDGECLLYPSSVEKDGYGDIVRRSEDFIKGISIDTQTKNLSHNSKKQYNEEDANTAEQRTGRPGLDPTGKKISESFVSVTQKNTSDQHNEEEVSDNKGKSEIEAHVEHMEPFSLFEKETADIPVGVFDQLLEGDKIDVKTENEACEAEKCSGKTKFSKSLGILEATVFGVDYLGGGPEIMAQTEMKKAQKDGEEKITSSGLEDSMSETSSLSIYSKKESMSGTMKCIKDLCISSGKSIDTVKDNLEEESNSLFEKDFKDRNGSSKTLMNKSEMEDKNLENNTENQGEDMDKNEKDKNAVDTFVPKVNSKINVKGPLKAAMGKPEECTAKAMMRQEGSDMENLDEALMLISKTIGTLEPIDEISFSKLGDIKFEMANLDDQQKDKNALRVENCDTSKVSKDVKEKGEEKKDVSSETQSKEKEKQKIEVLFEEKFHNEEAFEKSNTTEVTSDDGTTKPDEVTTKCTSTSKEEKKLEFVEPEPEKRQGIQNAEEFTETETKQKASDSNLQESRIASPNNLSSLKDRMVKVSVSGKEHSAEESIGNDIKEERSNINYDTGKENEAGVKAMLSKNIQEEMSDKPHVLPKQNHDISFPDGSKRTNETIFSARIREDNPLQQEDQFKNSNDVSNVACVSPGKANNDSTEQESERGRAESSNVEVQTNRNAFEVHGSDETSGADIVDIIDKVDKTIEERNDDLRDHNQINSTHLNCEAQGLDIGTKDIVATSASTKLSYDSIGLAKRKEAILEEKCENQENENTNNTKDIVFVEENNEPVDAVEKLDSCIKADASCEISFRPAEARKPKIGKNSMDTEAQYSIFTEKLRWEGYDEDQALYNTKTEILEAEGSSLIKLKEAAEEAVGQNFHKQAESIKKEALEEDFHNAMMERKPFSKEFETQISHPPQHHDESSLQVIKVEAHEICGSNEIQKAEELKNAKFEGSSSDKAEENQEHFEISQSQDDLGKIYNNGVRITEAEATTDTQHGNTEDGKSYSIIDGLSAEQIRGADFVEGKQNSKSTVEDLDQDINAKSDSIEVLHNKKTHTEIVFNKIYGGVENFLACNDKYTRSSCAKIQVSWIEEEASFEEQKHGAEDPNIISSISTYKVTGEKNEQENDNETNMEEVEQDMNAEIEIIEGQKDEIAIEQTGSCDIYEKKGANNEDIIIQNSKPSDSSSGKQDEEILETSKAENTASRKDECTRIPNEDIQISEVENETMDKHQWMTGTSNPNKSSNKVTGVELLPADEVSTNILENDTNSPSNSMGVPKEEKTSEQVCSNEIHETVVINNEELADQTLRESNCRSAKQDHEIGQASTLVEVASCAPCKDECTRISSEEINNSEVKEAEIGKHYCNSEIEGTKNFNNGSLCEVHGVEILLVNEIPPQIVEDVEKDTNNNSQGMEASKDESMHKETGSIEFYDIDAFNQEKGAHQCLNMSNSIPLREAETLVPSKEECTSLSNEEIQLSEVEEEAKHEKRQCSVEDQNKITYSILSNDVRRTENEPENENSVYILEAVNQATDVELESIEIKCHCNEIYGTKAANKGKTGQSSKENDPCKGEQDLQIAQAFAQLAEFDSSLQRKDAVEKEPLNQDQNKTKNGFHSDRIRELEITTTNQYSMNIVEDVDQDRNPQFNTIEPQKKENTHEQLVSNEISETREVNNEEIVNQCSKESNFYSGKKDQEFVEAFASRIKSQDLASSNNEYTSNTSDKIQLNDVDEAAQLEKAHCKSKNNDQNDIEHDVSPNQFQGVEIVPRNENSTNKLKDVHQDTNAGIHKTEVQKDGKTQEQTGLKEKHETEVGNNKNNKDQSFGERNFYIAKEAQEIVEASRTIIEAEIPIPSIEEYTTISSEQFHISIKEEPTIDFSETKDSYKKRIGVSSYHIRSAEIVEGNENSKNILDDVDQDISSQSGTIEVQKDERIYETNEPIKTNETHAINNEEIKCQGPKDSDSYNGKQDQEISKACTSFKEAENPVPSDDECKIQLGEVEDAATEKQQCSSENKNPNQIKSERVEPEAEYENSTNKVGYVDKDLELYGNMLCKQTKSIEDDKGMNTQSDRMEAQKDDKKHEQIGFNDAHETEDINREVIGNQGSNESNSCIEKQDQEIGQASISIIEVEKLVPGSDKCTKTSYEDIQISEVEEEATIEKQQEVEDQEFDDAKKEADFPKGTFSYRNKDECQFFEKSEQTTDIKYQQDSSSELVSETNIAHKSQIITDTHEEPGSFDQITKKIVHGLTSEVTDKEKAYKTADSGLTLEEQKSKEIFEENKVAKCNATSTKVTKEAKMSDESKKFPREATKEICEQASSAEKTEYKDYQQAHKHEKQLELTEPFEIIGSNLQDNLLQGDVAEVLDINRIVETQQTKEWQNFSPEVEELETLSAQDAKEITDGFNIGQDPQDVSSSNMNANQSIEKLGLNDAEREVEFSNLKAVHMDCQSIKGNDTVASDISQKNEAEEPLQKASCKHLKKIDGTDKLVTEMEKKAEEISNEELTKLDETCDEKDHQTKNSELKADLKALSDFGVHEAARSDDKLEKNTVLSNDPTAAQQTMLKIERTISIIDDEAAIKATTQGLPQPKDSKEFIQIENTKCDIGHIQSIVEEKKQELQKNCDNLPVSSKFQDSCNDVSMEKGDEEPADNMIAIGDRRQLHDDSMEHEECNKTKVWVQKEISPPKDSVKNSLEITKTDNPSIVKNERTDENLKERHAGSNTLHSTETLSCDLMRECTAQTNMMVVKSISDEKKIDEQEDSDLMVPLISETSTDAELKATHRKSHYILSGVGSKVKYSISKVKKAMTCTSSQFATENVLVKLNKNKKSSDKV